MSVLIPAGDYVLDQGVLVKVIIQGRKRFLQSGSASPVEIKKAEFGKHGWAISCRLFQNDFKATLSKKPVPKKTTATPAS